MNASIAETVFASMTPVALRGLAPCDSLPFDLFVAAGDSATPRLAGARGAPLRAVDLERLRGRGVEILYVAASETRAFSRYLHEQIMRDESRPPAERFEMLRDATRRVFNEALERGDVDSLLNAGRQYGGQLAECLGASTVVLDELLGVMLHDYDTFNHATNVAAYSLLLAHRFGIRKVEELTEVALGALLHDVGKRFLGADLLHKPDRLTAVEQRLVRRHPQQGFETLCHRDDLTWGALMMVYQHHERCDGRGYPQGLAGKETHPLARICAIADVFDALTRDRSYRGAFRKGDVLAYLDRESGRGFDEEMVRCWIEVMN